MAEPEEIYEIRSEQEPLGTLQQTLSALRDEQDPKKLAELVLMAAMLLGDSWCLCTEKSATYGEDDPGTATCGQRSAEGSRELLSTLEEVFTERMR